jgi:hypothetical protein
MPLAETLYMGSNTAFDTLTTHCDLEVVVRGSMEAVAYFTSILGQAAEPACINWHSEDNLAGLAVTLMHLG